jgi:hypothetical protein
MNRHTIASATLPAEIIKNSYSKMSEDQRKQLHRMLNDELDNQDEIDKPIWEKFKCFLDDENRFIGKSKTGYRGELEVFKCDEKFYVVDDYLESPFKGSFYLDDKKWNINKK